MTEKEITDERQGQTDGRFMEDGCGVRRLHDCDSSVFNFIRMIMAVKEEGMLFDEYEVFVEKFKPKKTTDDCYTPAEVYDCVLKWVNDNITDLSGLNVVRPFKPGGDYIKDMESYDAKTVVIDNPPFSILSEIKKTYRENGIKYFLFGPHLTIFGSFKDETVILTNTTITYENGAVVNTDFVTNMADKEIGIIVDGSLRNEIINLQKEKKKNKPHPPLYRYPSNLITSTTFDSILLQKPDFRLNVPRCEIMKVRRLDSQIMAKKAIFGGGFIVSDNVARKADEARRKADEARRKADEARRKADEARRKADEAGRIADEAGRIVWDLSESERQIIDYLNKKTK